MDIDFSEADIQRYARHILLPEVGGIGQARLAAARVLVVGAGGLGAPLVLYLAAAGVGRIEIVDDDVVELSNLQRQVAFVTADLGAGKARTAGAAARAINPGIEVVAHDLRLHDRNATRLVEGADIVCDGSDNFVTRYVVSDACVSARTTLVSAAVLRFEGQLSVFKPHVGDLPCYRCLHPHAPPPGMAPSCAEAGVLGAVTGVLGTLQASEVLKEILGIGESLAGRLLLWDALSSRMRTIRVPRDPSCAHAVLAGQEAALA